MSEKNAPETRTTVAVHGATGYAARELLTILLRHPGARVTALTTRRDDAPHVAEVHPALRGRLDLRCENLSPEGTGGAGGVRLLLHPPRGQHGRRAGVAGRRGAGGRPLRRLSIGRPGRYTEWYGLDHADPGRLAGTVYGLPELNRDRIPGADLVANPGCYTSAAILALAPLLAGGLIEPAGIVIDAKSGASGAGRNPKPGTLYCEVNEGLAAYAVGGHRHQPEIELALSKVAGDAVDVLFTPHLVPMDRGILATIYCAPRGDGSAEKLRDAMTTFYSDAPFVRVTDKLPNTKWTAGTNYCDLSVRVAKGRVVVFAALDNLVKGAAGAAAQNFNLMTGRAETCGFPGAGG